MTPYRRLGLGQYLFYLSASSSLLPTDPTWSRVPSRALFLGWWHDNFVPNGFFSLLFWSLWKGVSLHVILELPMTMFVTTTVCATARICFQRFICIFFCKRILSTLCSAKDVIMLNIRTLRHPNVVNSALTFAFKAYWLRSSPHRLNEWTKLSRCGGRVRKATSWNSNRFCFPLQSAISRFFKPFFFCGLKIYD